MCIFYCFLISRVVPQLPSRATVSAGENQSNKFANFYRKSCQSRQRVMILEGGFRGWEAHDLPIQQIETKLSQKACDQLALIGKDVSKLTGWNACDQLAVKIGQSVSKLMAECHVMSSRHSSNACRHQHSAVSIQYHPLVEANIASPTTRRRMARSM